MGELTCCGNVLVQGTGRLLTRDRFVYNVGNGYIDNLEIPTDPAAEAYELERGGGAPAREMLLRESQAR